MIKKLFGLYDKYKEIVNYLIAGFLTTLVSIISYNLFRFVVDYILSTILSWIVAVIFAYFINRVFVFRSKDKRIIREAAKFIGCRLLTLGFEIVFMYVMIDLLKVNDRIAKIIVQFLVVILNYILSKLIAFRKKKD